MLERAVLHRRRLDILQVKHFSLSLRPLNRKVQIRIHPRPLPFHLVSANLTASAGQSPLKQCVISVLRYKPILNKRHHETRKAL